MKKLAFLSWALLALLMVGCSDDSVEKELELPEFELIEMGDHHLFMDFPSHSYGNFGMIFHKGNEFCTFVSDDIEEEYTAEEIFELADEIKPTSAIDTKSVLKNLYRQQRLWVAVRNDAGYAVKSAIVERNSLPMLYITVATTNIVTHYNFNGYPDSEYYNFFLSFNHNCEEYAVFVCELSNTTEQDEEYTAEEIFELADEILQAEPMCTCRISTTLSVPKLEDTPLRIWVAARNEKYYAVDSIVVGQASTITDPIIGIPPAIIEIEM